MRNAMSSLCCATLAALIASSLGAVAPKAGVLKGAAFLPQAKISLATAKTTALQARPGTITDQEIEKEKGGSGLRYSFDITSKGKPYEVGVDAKTGKVLENGQEGAHPD